jgi:hypothetical protein
MAELVIRGALSTPFLLKVILVELLHDVSTGGRRIS